MARKQRSDKNKPRKKYRKSYRDEDSDRPTPSRPISTYDTINLPIRAVSTGTRVSSEIRGWSNLARSASRF